MIQRNAIYTVQYSSVQRCALLVSQLMWEAERNKEKRSSEYTVLYDIHIVQSMLVHITN